MANTFLAAQGIDGRQVAVRAGPSGNRAQDHCTWRRKAAAAILLPTDVVVAKEFKADAAHRTVAVGADRAPTKWCWMSAPTPSRPSRTGWTTPGRWCGTARSAPSKPRPSTRAPWRRRKPWPRRTKAGKLLSRGGRRRYGGGAGPCRRGGRFHLCLDRGRGIPGMAGRQELPGVAALQTHNRGQTMDLDELNAHRQEDGGHGQGPAGGR